MSGLRAKLAWQAVVTALSVADLAVIWLLVALLLVPLLAALRRRP